MRRTSLLAAAAALSLILLPTAVVEAQASAAAAENEDIRLYAFLDAEFAELLKRQPQTATRLGIKEAGTAGTTSARRRSMRSLPGGGRARRG